jgi:arylsulfatase A-like enzyme
VKPHWPYMAPAPYHDMYSAKDVLPLNRDEQEKVNEHPVLAAYRQHEESVSFSRPEAPGIVRPAYMGLIRQLDDWLGRLFAHMKKTGRLDDTLILFTSDHGDFLGDHWLGEKEMFYEEAMRVPFIVADPDAAADATRGTVDNRFVEAIDVVPTILESLGLPRHDNVVEGRSLIPLTRGAKSENSTPVAWRDAVFSELDYSFREARLILKRQPGECRAIMVRTDRWKYVWWQDFRPMLFDLQADPQERRDLGTDPAHEGVRAEMDARIGQWARSRKTRVTVDDAYVAARTAKHKQHGIFFGVW